MAEKVLNTRIALKIDTLENWEKSTLGLKKGELAFATVAATAGTGLTEPVVMVKIGEDGIKTFKDLEYNFYAKASDVLAACKSEKKLKEFVNGVIADAGIATDEALKTLAGRVTTAEGDIDNLEAAVALLNGNAETAGSVAKAIADAIAALNLDTTYVKVADLTAERTKLAGVSEGANKVESSLENGQIKIDGVETVVYNDSDLVSRVSGLETESAKHALKTDVATEFAKYKTAEAQKAIDDEQDRRLGVIEGDYLKAADIADFETKANVKKVADDLTAYKTSNDAALAGVKATADAAAVKTEVNAALELKADKSVVDNMYTNSKINELIAAEADRADKAEKANAAAIKAIADDYLTSEDKTDLEGDIAGLQTQINTIMNNPDAEGAINSINEFTQYVKDHGEIAEGFRTDINKNKEDIAAEVKRAGEAEAALDERLDAVEAVLGTGEGSVAEQIATAVAGGVTEAKNYTNTQIGTLTEATVVAEIAAAKTAANANTTEVIKNYYTKTEADAAFMDSTETGAAIDEKIAALKLAETYDAKGDAAKAETNAKAYADGLAGNYATKEQGATADSALQTVKVLGTELSKGSNELTVEAAKTALGLGTAAYKPASDFATAVQGGKADTALQAADITTGSANGTIAVKGANVAVHGLGSAAYTEASAYATSAQGAKADTALQEITAGDGLKVTNKNQIDIDETVVFVFDCGDSGVASN